MRCGLIWFITMSPLSVISFATSPARRMFSTPVGLGEAEVATQPMADVVAVEQHGVVAGGLRPPLDDLGDR